MLRAFNGECDAAIVKTRWNNEVKMEERIKRAFDAINKMGESHKITIGRSYLDLKLAELRLTFEYNKKKYDENEEQKEIRAQMREEERALQEAEKARDEAEKEELRYEEALEKAKKEIGQLQGEKLEELKQLKADRKSLLEKGTIRITADIMQQKHETYKRMLDGSETEKRFLIRQLIEKIIIFNDGYVKIFVKK